LHFKKEDATEFHSFNYQRFGVAFFKVLQVCVYVTVSNYH